LTLFLSKCSIRVGKPWGVPGAGEFVSGFLSVYGVSLGKPCRSSLLLVSRPSVSGRPFSSGWQTAQWPL
jgi:hypothetical protein